MPEYLNFVGIGQALSALIPEQHHSPVLMSSEQFRQLNGSSRLFVFLFHT